MNQPGNLIELPEVVLENIFSFLTYDNIAQNRLVCAKFNEIGGKMLNKGYYVADRFHGKTLKSIKSKLPRRESERRVHPLARQCDILIAIETRLSMLSMTFTKWIDAKLCCFIPGKVIDEIMRVLRCVANNPNPPRAHEILQELRDISSMAMEHFDEKILPSLKVSMGMPSYIPDRFCPLEPPPRLTNGHFFRRISSWKGNSSPDIIEDELTIVPTHKRMCVFPLLPPNSAVSVADFNKLIVRVSINKRKIKSQNELITQQANEISELRRHVEEWEAKLRDLTANMAKAKDLPSTSSTIMQTRKREGGPNEDVLKKKVKKN